MNNEKVSAVSVIKAMGLVFGDIGTSPIYTFTVLFLTLQVNYENILGILSLIIWTILLVVSVQYAWLAMSLSKRGEGGAIVLNEILKRLLKSSRAVAFFSLLTFIGVSLLIGDSAITPAISILSAVEGLRFIEQFQYMPQCVIMLVTLVIAIALFSIQKHGTEKISKVFGPIMLVWFLTLGIFGVISIFAMPSVFMAFNPLIGLNFIMHHGIAGFFVLSEVILCVTGAEALYADMGHLGRKPITYAWAFVSIMLYLNYLGQGAFLINHPHVNNILFGMIFHTCHALYLPFLVLSILATIIASQSMISGLFSIIYQGINTRILPLFKVNYTSEIINSQIYIGAANWFLLFFVILIILIFQKSSNLAAAYGLAVTGTITITGIMVSLIYYLRKKYIQFLVALFLLMIDIIFLIAASSKLLHGGYWSLIIALIPLSIILLYTQGQKALYKSLVFMEKDVFLEKFNTIYPIVSKIKGTSLFFTRGIDKVPPYVIQTLFTNNIFYSENIFIQINKTNCAFGLDANLNEITSGLKVLVIDAGYMEIFKLEKVLKELGIKPKVIFYGVEDIDTENPVWNVFALVKKITPAFVSFYNMPAHKTHGVITKVKIK